MAALIDNVVVSDTQQLELHEEGIVWIIDTSKHVEIKLDALAATQLMDFLLLHGERLHRHAKVIRYNREMDARNKLIREGVEKPWLPLHDGE